MLRLSRISGLINPVVPQGQPIIATVEDLQGETRLKVDRARQAVDLTTRLLALDIIVSSNWMEVRKAQDPSRRFGAAPTALLAGLRGVCCAGSALVFLGPPAAKGREPLDPVTVLNCGLSLRCILLNAGITAALRRARGAAQLGMI